MPEEFSDEELRGLIESAGGPASLGRAIGYPILALKDSLVAQAAAANRLTNQMWWLTLVGIVVALAGVAVAILPIIKSACR